jgi:sulfotransferase family protein
MLSDAIARVGKIIKSVIRPPPDVAALAAERDAYLHQRDVAIGECNELKRQLDVVQTKVVQAVRRAEIKPNPHRSPQNSIFIATLPKSGTEFIWGGIQDATSLRMPAHLADETFMRSYLSGYCNRDDIYSTGVFTSERLILDELRKLNPNGVVHASHCMATHHNVCTLHDAGFQRITVLVRDPRDSTVSWTYHLRAPAMGERMRNFNSLIQHLPTDYFSWPHGRQLAFQVRTFLPAAVNWIESWIEASRTPDKDHALEIQIVHFDDLRTDPRGMFESVFAFHGVADYDLAKIQPAKAGARHFRRGETGTWRDEFSATDIAFADNLLNGRLQSFLAR